MSSPAGFSEFVGTRYPALVRYGVLPTGDRGHGEDLVQSALVKTFGNWPRLHPDGQPEAYTRTVRERMAWRMVRRRWHGELPTVVSSVGGLGQATPEFLALLGRLAAG
jgi:DNA-directed RNA polymerase specialized sigma24 family protein